MVWDKKHVKSKIKASKSNLSALINAKSLKFVSRLKNPLSQRLNAATIATNTNTTIQHSLRFQKQKTLKTIPKQEIHENI